MKTRKALVTARELLVGFIAWAAGMTGVFTVAYIVQMHSTTLGWLIVIAGGFSVGFVFMGFLLKDWRSSREKVKNGN